MARQLKWKSYMVFQRGTIAAIDQQRPRSHEALARIPGLGPAKIARFGDDILALVRQALAVVTRVAHPPVPWEPRRMSDHPTDFVGSIPDAITTAVQAKILPDAKVQVSGGGGHYTISVVSTAFAGKSMLESQRLVLGSIKHLINGNSPPVHAVDSLTTRTP